MSKLAVDKLTRKVPKIKGKFVAGAKSVAKKVKRKVQSFCGTPSNLERTPAKDTVEIAASKQTGKVAKSDNVKSETSAMRVGDFLVRQNSKLAEVYTRDLYDVAQSIPEASFVPDANKSTSKSLKSILDKLENRTEQYADRGFKGVVRDVVRGTIFMPDADKNYMKIVKAMEKKGYKIADTFAEDANGSIVFDKPGVPKMVKDVDVRFGDNAVPSGYEDVQMRFQKGDNLYELLILPGPNYSTFKHMEHTYVFESTRKYKVSGITKDSGADQIVKGIKKELHNVTRQLYADAKLRDTEGARHATRVTFTPEAVKKLDGMFASLKELYFGKYSALPPSKRKKPFEETRMYGTLDSIEQTLREFMDLYKPIEK